MSDTDYSLDSESEVNGIIRNLRSELAAATEIGYRWMGNYKDKEKECDELRLLLRQIYADLDAYDVFPEWLPIIDAATKGE